jgi:ATP-dependent Clp protease adaptor protein ClpS
MIPPRSNSHTLRAQAAEGNRTITGLVDILMAQGDGMSTSNSGVIEKPKSEQAKPKEKPAEKPKRQPPYAVVVQNDDDHTYAYVIEGLCRFCGHSPSSAFKLAEQIDRTGRAPVWTGVLEVAELKRDQLRGMGPDFYAMRPVNYPLAVTLEPLPT